MPIPDGDLKQRFQTLHEFVKAAREKLDRDNWDYLIGAVETETTYARNRLALDSLGLRPRVLRDVSDINCGATLFGKRLRIPVLCAPVGAFESFDPDGAASVARAVDRFGMWLGCLGGNGSKGERASKTFNYAPSRDFGSLKRRCSPGRGSNLFTLLDPTHSTLST
jgi:hypothetical protein